TISRPSADINFILVGGQGNDRPISQVQFNSPVALQLAGLLANVQRVGPGNSLVSKALQAQADYAAGDLSTACSMLASFVHEVDAQDGKHVAHLKALQLLSVARAIETAVDCR